MEENDTKRKSGRRRRNDALEGLKFAIYKDILDGYNYGRVIRKMESDGYESQCPVKTSEMTLEMKRIVYKDALQKLRVDQSEIDDLRTLYYQRYEKLYQEALESGDRQTALSTLNSMTKMMGLMTEKKDVTLKSVVDVKFGFNDDSEE